MSEKGRCETKDVQSLIRLAFEVIKGCKFASFTRRARECEKKIPRERVNEGQTIRLKKNRR